MNGRNDLIGPTVGDSAFAFANATSNITVYGEIRFTKIVPKVRTNHDTMSSISDNSVLVDPSALVGVNCSKIVGRGTSLES